MLTSSQTDKLLQLALKNSSFFCQMMEDNSLGNACALAIKLYPDSLGYHVTEMFDEYITKNGGRRDN
ncbi:hypothetical protein [Candidatus Mesenet endosymbiont of Agriotes lineatus]|uniref:hypothetical protein n=1 Tax=Candidatus Mesenet endosymbiont of Agriotes lineatus TaxID=3077948 RepID=UPI0030D228B8